MPAQLSDVVSEARNRDEADRGEAKPGQDSRAHSVSEAFTHWWSVPRWTTTSPCLQSVREPSGRTSCRSDGQSRGQERERRLRSRPYLEFAENDKAVVERNGPVHWRDMLGRHIYISDDGSLCTEASAERKEISASMVRETARACPLFPTYSRCSARQSAGPCHQQSVPVNEHQCLVLLPRPETPTHGLAVGGARVCHPSETKANAVREAGRRLVVDLLVHPDLGLPLFVMSRYDAPDRFERVLRGRSRSGHVGGFLRGL